MNIRCFCFAQLIAAICLFTGCDKIEKDLPTKENEQKKEESEIRAEMKSYVEAVNRRDLDAIVNSWASDTVYRNPITGKLVQGRDGIREEYRKIFDQLKGASVELKIDKIEFPIEEKASEEGIAILTVPGRDPIYSDYKMIHVKQNGKWLITHVSQLDFGMLAQEPSKEEKGRPPSK